MEETWELAAVSGYKNRHEDDWSGRHVRIRFEMVLSAVVFFIVAKYGSTEVRLPIIGLKSEIKDDFLMWAALGFSIFSIIALLTRSHYEKMRWPKEELSNRREIAKFENDFLEIQKISTSLGLDDSRSVKDTSEYLAASFKEIKNLNLKTNRFLGSLSDLHSENGFDSPVHPKFWAKTVPMMASVNTASNAILKHASHAHASESTKTVMGTSSASIHDSVNLLYSTLLEGLDALKPEIEERKNALLKLAFTKVFQREILSYGLPILTVTLLILSGLYCKFCGCSA